MKLVGEYVKAADSEAKSQVELKAEASAISTPRGLDSVTGRKASRINELKCKSTAPNALNAIRH